MEQIKEVEKKESRVEKKEMAKTEDIHPGELHGLQVLSISKAHRYTIDEKGLQGLLGLDGVKDLPVVVVTVAGAYRMGKSFLLDYFLRFLKAPVEKQSNGEWLGAPDEPLTGFSWRGGSERHTTGMIMWHEPVFAYLPTGQKVLVILMDTQGTFDSESTVKDNSTVFALSTLLSSVLIYNLKENIKEDDLQHLELFTKYGEMVKTEKDKAFQTLEFLVRDYPFPEENPYGQKGGQDLLNRRLEAPTDMSEDKRSLRQHIRSAFETVTAYLLPHPGLKVTKAGYDGRHGELEEEFKTYLRDLVSSLFASDKLTLKKINGEYVKAQDLLTYIDTYVKIFDSDKLPEPMDIVKATTKAGLLLASREATQLYESFMEKECGQNVPSMPVAQVNFYHKRGMLEALKAFQDKKKMGTKKEIDPYYALLNQELESRLKTYLTMNYVKVQKAKQEANEAYDKYIRSVTLDKPLCLHPSDLDDVHAEALAEAEQVFNSRRKQIPGMRDEEKTVFLQSFDVKYKSLVTENRRNNMLYSAECLLEYNSTMNALLGKDPPLDEQAFEGKHEQALAAAQAAFAAKRNRTSDQPDDSFKSTLYEKIMNHFLNIKNINRSKHRRAMQAAIAFYNNSMTMFWDPEENCLHPDDLKKEHQRVKAQAMRMFKSESDNADDLETMLVAQNMELQYRELKDVNNEGNETAIDSAYRKYKAYMDENCSASAWWLLVVPIIVHYAKKWDYHTEAKALAHTEFYSHRKDMNNGARDRYKEKLDEKLDDAYRMY